MKPLSVVFLFLASATVAQEVKPLPQGEIVIEGRITRAPTGADVILNGNSIHLDGVRAPMRGRICIRGGENVDIGSEAADGLEHKLAGAKVIMQTRLDESGRLVGNGTANGQDIGEVAITNGFATSKIGDVTYAKQEREARNARSGLWACSSFPKVETRPEAANAGAAPQPLPPPIELKPLSAPKSGGSIEYAPSQVQTPVQPVDPEDDFDLVLDDVGGFFEDVFKGIDRSIREVFGAPPPQQR